MALGDPVPLTQNDSAVEDDEEIGVSREIQGEKEVEPQNTRDPNKLGTQCLISVSPGSPLLSLVSPRGRIPAVFPKPYDVPRQSLHTPQLLLVPTLKPPV